MITLPPGRHRVVLGYRSRGLDRWAYAFGAGAERVGDFSLTVHTDFDKVDFPSGSLAPTKKEKSGAGWALTWRFENLLSGSSISVAMPQKVNPGPFASEIALFAPVSLAFFFLVLLLVSVIKQVRLHPMHFTMLAAAFFAFHVLFAYLVDHTPLLVAFGASSVTSVALVVSYRRLVVGRRFALLWAGGAQLLYLVLFSLAFLFKGYAGLTITIFSILTLFAVMQLTARIDWFAKFAPPTPPAHPAPPPAPHAPAPAPDAAFSRVG